MLEYICLLKSAAGLSFLENTDSMQGRVLYRSGFFISIAYRSPSVRRHGFAPQSTYEYDIYICMEGFTLSRITIILLIILLVLLGILIALYFAGKRLEARQAESEAQIQSMKQPMTLLVIDKKRLRLKESGLPDQVIQQTPWYAKRSKVCVVKAKVGPQFINFICDDKIFDSIPVKKQVKAMVSGIYIVEVKGMRGKLPTDGEPKKKTLLEKLQEKAGAKPVK